MFVDGKFSQPPPDEEVDEVIRTEVGKTTDPPIVWVTKVTAPNPQTGKPEQENIAGYLFEVRTIGVELIRACVNMYDKEQKKWELVPLPYGGKVFIPMARIENIQYMGADFPLPRFHERR